MAVETTTHGAAAAAATVSSEENSLEELELALATRPRRKLTAEEKVQRRRLQYKLHQRRHRAKQKDRTFELEKEVCQLAESVARLQDKWHMLKSNNVFEARSTLVGAPARVTMEYLRLFGHGYAQHRGVSQEQFLRSVLDPNIAGPDYEGIDVVVEQWQLYGQVFLRTLFVPDTMDVSVAGDMTIVVIQVNLQISSQREGLINLYPNLQGEEEVIQAMVGHPILVPGKVRLVFDQNGVCTWLGHEMDFVCGLQRALGSLAKVAACMQDARISFCTGQIVPRRPYSPPRLAYNPGSERAVDYLLV